MKVVDAVVQFQFEVVAAAVVSIRVVQGLTYIADVVNE